MAFGSLFLSSWWVLLGLSYKNIQIMKFNRLKLLIQQLLHEYQNILITFLNGSFIGLKNRFFSLNQLPKSVICYAHLLVVWCFCVISCVLKRCGMAQPSESGRQRTLNIVHAQTAAQQQSNGSYEARMSGKCGEWRD